MRSLQRARSVVIPLVTVLILSACGGSDGDTGGGGGHGIPDTPTSDTTTDIPTGGSGPPPQSAPTSCEHSQMSLSDAADIPGVRLAQHTDPTGSTLLLTNTGQLSAVVIPDPLGNTRLAEARYVDPTDPASQAVLEAVVAAADPYAVPGVTRDIPANQVYFVPPGWSVCGTTGNVEIPAQARYLRDKPSSAMHYAAKAMADQLIQLVTPQNLKRSQTLQNCAKDIVGLVNTQPDLTDLDLYTTVIKGETDCRQSYKVLLGDSAEAERTEQRALTWLESAPKLLEESRFWVAIAHR